MYTRRYGGPTSSSCGGLQPLAEAFFALWAQKEPIMLFWLIFGNFWYPVVTLVTFSSNLSNFERNPPPKKNPRKIRKLKKKIKKNPRIKKKKILNYKPMAHSENKPAAQAAGTDPSRCNSTPR